jgi:hypothetical protein
MAVAHAADRMAVRADTMAVLEVIPAVREATAAVAAMRAATAAAAVMLAASAVVAVMVVASAVAEAMAAADTGKQLRFSSERLVCFGRRAIFCGLKL